MKGLCIVRCLTAILSCISIVEGGTPWRSNHHGFGTSGSLPLPMRWTRQPQRTGCSRQSVALLTPRGGSKEPLGIDSPSSLMATTTTTTTTSAAACATATFGISESMARGGSSTIAKKRRTTATTTTNAPSESTSTTSPSIVTEPTAAAAQNASSTVATTTSQKVPQAHGIAGHAVQKESNRQRHKRHKSIAKKLKNRNHTNLRRKVLHASFGLVFCGLNHFIPKAKFVPGMTILTSATLLMELLRYRKGFGWMNDILHFVLGSSLRKHEMDGKFTGSFYYFLGVTVTSALYSKTCATLGILQLAIADPTASYFGRQTRHVYWSRIENGLGGFGRNKGILGFLGGAAACVPFNYRLLSLAKYGASGGIPGGAKSLWFASIALGLAGAFADLAVPTPTLTLPKKVCGVRVPPFHVDDNFVVPIFSGYACTKIFDALAWPSNVALSKWMFL